MENRIVREHTILGIDPGTNIMGYAILHAAGNKTDLIDLGVLDMRKEEMYYARLQRIFFFTQEIIERHNPTELAIESQFVQMNIQSTLKLGKGQGVAIAAALAKDIPVNEYAPLKIKMAITGNGQASKEQVADMLRRMMHIPDELMPKKLDATDALACAYCHFLQLDRPFNTGKSYSGWKDYISKNPNKIH